MTEESPPLTFRSALAEGHAFSDEMLAEGMIDVVGKHAKHLQQHAIATQWQADAGSATYRKNWEPLAKGDWTLYFGMSPNCCGFVGKVHEIGPDGKLLVQWETPDGLEEPCWESPLECAPIEERWAARLDSLPYEARLMALKNKHQTVKSPLSSS
mmetsp:Transcript_42578/g.85452  ORF Transcript_42578/g.85452 Transcript_42578/m.85452 type:complete len:155 (-) Transcript_42578:89-553(-)|eukprot:CAMPEP_0174733422 /NCGR_PEP_ID=MMETSP1094-20130205/61283_1 /TAXON_ID=156173 /ORGANISM="Chrysochromulina brevifilum, Strain UTEX LB 985" /LENGTH=154 /DNA_ID=CAMNT_0015936073 /DNA_START=185 /DNA_END=649 /DNA_ORIENTATION=-